MEIMPTTERGWWDLLSTQTPESMRWKAEYDRGYAQAQEFLRAKGGIKNCVDQLGKEVLKGHQMPKAGFFEPLRHAHPRALLLLAKYGVEFKPQPWQQKPPFEPTPHRCYRNAFLYQHHYNNDARYKNNSKRLWYVEGVAVRSKPVLHAWNALDDKAVDSSWYAFTGWSSYFGLRLTEREYKKARRLAGHIGNTHVLLLQESIFPLVENYLTEVLRKRAEQLQKTSPPSA